MVGKVVVLAPCRKDGEVTTVDYDTKDGVCICGKCVCLVDGRNHLLYSEAKAKRKKKNTK